MNRPLFRARNIDPSKRIRLLVDQHDSNNNDLSKASKQALSGHPALVSHASTSVPSQTSQPSSGSTSQLPQRCVPQMPFVSGMEREEEAEYHLQNALDAQRRLGSAKIRAVPIPNLYEDTNSQAIYPANVEAPKQLIRLQPLQLESDEPEYDMDEVDHRWFAKTGRALCPDLTHLDYETIVDKLENASTRTLVSLDEARALFASSIPIISNDRHIRTVYDVWHERRTIRDKRLKPRVLTERDIKEEKGKHHPYVAFRRRVEKMTTRKNRKNDEQAYMSMLKLRANFEAVVKLTKLIKTRETAKASLLECALTIFRARCESATDDPETMRTSLDASFTLPTNHDRLRHARAHLKTSLLMNSNQQHLSSAQHQQLLAHLIRMENQKKNQAWSSPLTHLLQSPIQSQKSRSLSTDPNDPFQQKSKRLKVSHRKATHADKLTQLLTSPTLPPSASFVHNSQQQRPSQGNRRPLKASPSGTTKKGKNHRNLLPTDFWSLADSTPGGAVLLKAQLLEVARKLQQKEELENRASLQDGSSVLSNTNESIHRRLDDDVTSMDDEPSMDPWQFRPKAGCRYQRPINQDEEQQQQRIPGHDSAWSSSYSVVCPEQGHLGKRRVRRGRGGRLLFDRHLEQEHNESIDEPFNVSHFTVKPVLWRLSSRPSLTESYRFHSYSTVADHTRSLTHHYQSKSSSSIHLNNSHSLTETVGGQHRSTSFELDHPYSCSSQRVHQALSSLVEPQPPSPSSPSPLTSATPLSAPEQLMLISTPPTPPPPLPTLTMDNLEEQPLFAKSSSTFVLTPSTPFFPVHHQSYVIPSTPPPSSQPSLAVQSSKSSPCSLVQFVQLQRILPSTKSNGFASSTPVTTFDS